MQRLTYMIVVAIVLVFMIFIGYLSILFYRGADRDETAANSSEETDEKSNEEICVELGCEPGSIYVGSKNLDKYYECRCHYALRIKPENRICFKSDGEAIGDNRTRSEC